MGVGSVKGTVQRVRDFTVSLDSTEVPILKAPLHAKAMHENAQDPEKSEYVVPVDWVKTLPMEEAVWGRGCSPTSTRRAPFETASPLSA